MIRENLTEAKVLGGFDYPIGPYVMKVVAKKNTENSKGGAQIEVKYRIEQGDLAGKPFTYWLGLTSESDGAKNWRRTFAEAHGINVTAEGWDDDALVNKTVVVVLGYKKNSDGTYDESKREPVAFRKFVNGNGTTPKSPASRFAK